MRTIDGYWRPGRKKAEELLSDVPTIKEKEAFIMAKMNEIFQNQVGDFTIFKAEMLDHFLLSIEEQVGDGIDKDDFCKSYYKTYKDLGGALMVRSMGYHSMQMSYKKLHRGFLYWWVQNKVACISLMLILILNFFVFDFNDIAIKSFAIILTLISIVIMIKSYYMGYIKLKNINSEDIIFITYREELKGIMALALVLSQTVVFTNSLALDKIYATVILMPLVYMLTCYYIYVESKFDDLTSKRTIQQL